MCWSGMADLLVEWLNVLVNEFEHQSRYNVCVLTNTLRKKINSGIHPVMG